VKHDKINNIEEEHEEGWTQVPPRKDKKSKNKTSEVEASTARLCKPSRSQVVNIPFVHDRADQCKTHDHQHGEKLQGCLRNSLQSKLSCRYVVGIEDDADFCVCRKIIGIAGRHIKDITAQCPHVAVLLRGRGSRLPQGSDKHDPEPLMICVSVAARGPAAHSEAKQNYERATKLVEELLSRVHHDYKKFCNERALPEPHLIIKRDNK